MFSPRVEAALAYACMRHAGQTRKGKDVPYFVHCVHVALMVARAVGDEDAVIVALLHDVVEDTPKNESERADLVEEMRSLFGESVTEAVLTLTEPKFDRSGARMPWQARKEAYLRQLEAGSTRALKVSAADKIHNLETLVESLETEGPAVWKRFRGGPDESRWFYGEVLRVLSGRLGPKDPLIQSLAEATARLDPWVGGPGV